MAKTNRLRASRAMLTILIVLALAGLIWFAFSQVMQGRILRADPDAIMGDAMLARFSIAKGRGIFKSECAVCHGDEGRGDRRMGVPDLTDHDWLYGEGRVSEIERVVAFGIRSHNPNGWNLAEMPAFAQEIPSKTEPIPPLAPADIRDVVEFLQQIGAHEANAGAAARGRAIFAGRGACYDCHGPDAAGDPAIGAPNLRDAIWLYGDGDRQGMFDSIANGRHGICPAWSVKLSPGSIRAVALYVYSLSHPSPSIVTKTD